MARSRFQFDEIGEWSQIKLDIVREYAAAYSRILARQQGFAHVYVEGFAGGGIHKLKGTGELVAGSPLNALEVVPRFKELHLIDINGQKIAQLRRLTEGIEDVHLYQGDCNSVLIKEVFPRIRWEEYRRGLCLLDPYGLHLDWNVLAAAGSMRSVEVFLNFPVMDMNRNALWSDPTDVDPDDVQRMNAFWGDDSWRTAAYQVEKTLFGDADVQKRKGNQSIVDAFRRRLRDVAGFQYVPEPIPMRNSKGATLYFLYFASHNKTGAKIAEHILDSRR